MDHSAVLMDTPQYPDLAHKRHQMVCTELQEHLRALKNSPNFPVMVCLITQWAWPPIQDTLPGDTSTIKTLLPKTKTAGLLLQLGLLWLRGKVSVQWVLWEEKKRGKRKETAWSSTASMDRPQVCSLMFRQSRLQAVCVLEQSNQTPPPSWGVGAKERLQYFV